MVSRHDRRHVVVAHAEQLIRALGGGINVLCDDFLGLGVGDGLRRMHFYGGGPGGFVVGHAGVFVSSEINS